MSATAAKYGFGARAPFAEPRAREYDMKEKARLSGRFPRVNDEPLSTTLAALVKDFQKNAALVAVLERRRALEGRSQYVLQSKEALDNINRGLAPWARVGRAVEASSARAAQRIARLPSPPPPPAEVPQDAGIPHFDDNASIAPTVGSTRVSDSATNPSVSIGQGTPQLTLDGRLATTKTKPQRKTKSVPGPSSLVASLTKYRAKPG